MKLQTQSPRKTVKALLKQKPLRSEMDRFKANLIELLDKINLIDSRPTDESEEHLKNELRDFLRDTWYKDSNAINTKDKKDLVIHLEKSTDSPVGVIIEAKRPSNVAEMISSSQANKKALHELILYYLNERIQAGNNQLKQLVATNINEWYIIDANLFDKHIYRNSQIKKLYETKISDKKDNPWFYEEIAKIVGSMDVEIPCTYFDMREYDTILRNKQKDDDRELIALQKILSPQFLLKAETPNDSNSLNTGFYRELLHIIGLEEAKEGSKNIIRRKEKGRNAASLIEAAIEAIETEDVLHRVKDRSSFGVDKQEQIYNIALELCITWINRILFLKLLEGQLVGYHQGDKSYRFLNSETVHDYDELFKLFHKVLAVNVSERANAVREKYAKVPYLNSSLFEISELEDLTIKINSLDNSAELDLLGTTVLKDLKKKHTSIPALEYLFLFLDAYDFASEGSEDIQEENKSIINASVLGKVFEKINGYKDGSIYTPAFITMYMCRQSIRLAVVQKFNEVLAKDSEVLFEKFEDVKNYTSKHHKTQDILKDNEIINSLHICDPAVGSGHFLVSALNELIVVKAELGILADMEGNSISGYEFDILNDELIITDPRNKDSTLDYKLANGKPITKEIQRLQKTLFHEKQTLIENCLFGVDINPNSVKICRLRLWIELLKNAYYKEETDFYELETLPNIDINIKCGNSLISRFDIDADLSKALKSIKYDINAYRGFVQEYKNEKNREVKRGLLQIIEQIKGDFKTELDKPFREKASKVRYTVDNILTEINTEKQWGKGKNKVLEKKLKDALNNLEKLEKEKDIIINNPIFKNSFEWRFEFPEVLNENGDFKGFDLIIGNPPYGTNILEDKFKEYFRTSYPELQFKIDTYSVFILKALKLALPAGSFTYIIPSTFLDNFFEEKIRYKLLTESQLQYIAELDDQVFPDAVVHSMIISVINNLPQPSHKISISASKTIFTDFVEVPADYILNQPQYAFSMRNFENKDFLQRISENTLPLFDVIDIRQAIKTGNDKIFISNIKTHRNFKPVIGGKHINKYKIDNSGLFVDYGKHLACPRDYKIFEQPKILIRETGKTITATYDDSNLYVLSSLYNAILKNELFSLKYILALINSKLFQFMMNLLTLEKTSGAFTKARIFHYYKLPIKNISMDEQKSFIELVDRVLKEKRENRDTKKYEAEIDQLVYKLYDLNSEDIKTIEGNLLS